MSATARPTRTILPRSLIACWTRELSPIVMSFTASIFDVRIAADIGLLSRFNVARFEAASRFDPARYYGSFDVTTTSKRGF
jgi:hypothetical protein